jgi:hypothetical protein
MMTVTIGCGALGSAVSTMRMAIFSCLLLYFSLRGFVIIGYTVAVIQEWFDYLISFALYIGLGSICYTVGAFAAPLVAPLTSTFKLVFGTQAAPAIASTAAATMPFAYTDSNFVTAGCLAIVSLGECLTGGYGHTGG